MLSQVVPIGASMKNTGHSVDHYIFANNGAGILHLAKTHANLMAAGITSEASTETIADTVCLVLTVTSKRPGEGQIAREMKARKA